MNAEDVRWRQRFGQFENAFLPLRQAGAIDYLTIVERAGLIQFFEMAFELGWKLLKDFEEAEVLCRKARETRSSRPFKPESSRRGMAGWMRWKTGT